MSAFVTINAAGPAPVRSASPRTPGVPDDPRTGHGHDGARHRCAGLGVGLVDDLSRAGVKAAPEAEWFIKAQDLPRDRFAVQPASGDFHAGPPIVR